MPAPQTQQAKAVAAGTPSGTASLPVPHLTFNTNASSGAGAYGGTGLPSSHAGAITISAITPDGSGNHTEVTWR
jgi:hypothetical protein